MSKFRKIETEIPDLFFIRGKIFSDERGYFWEMYQKGVFRELGIEKDFVQENISSSKRGVLRGLHFQQGKEQGKLLRVLKGSIYDVVVDIRKDSPTYKKWFATILKEEGPISLWIPEGFAHGFLSLEENTVIQYLCTEYYSPFHEKGILWNDCEININWKLAEFGFEEKDLLLSEKDRKNSSFSEILTEVKQKKVLLLGANGQLGKEFQRFFQKQEISVIATDLEELDITKKEDCKNFMNTNKISAVINCAAYNEVDRAEKEKMLCQRVNTEAVSIWTELCQEYKLPFLTFSTDFVFNGEKEIPYTEEDKANPLSVYGESKYLGEEIVLKYKNALVIRTSWLFGTGGNNFCKQVLAWAKEKEELHIVDNQVSSPTYAKHLVEFSWELLERGSYGLYHLSNDGETSKYEQAQYLLACMNCQGKLHRAKTEDFFMLAKRPKYSKLNTTKAEFTLQKKMPHWKIGIQEYLEELKKRGELL